jgi:hypothetical protein
MASHRQAGSHPGNINQNETAALENHSHGGLNTKKQR